MKTLRLILSVILVSLGDLAHAQSAAAPVARSDAQTSFAALKALAGNWQGPLSTDNPGWGTDKPMRVSMHVASSGNAFVWELQTGGGPEATVFYLDGDRLTLTHYCDFQNRLRMVARPSPAGTPIEFDLVEMAGIDAPGHVTHCVFTLVDANHHIEDWTFLIPGQKPFHGVMDFRRLP